MSAANDLIQVAKACSLDLGIAEWSSPQHAEEILEDIIETHTDILKDVAYAAETENEDLRKELEKEREKRKMFQEAEKNLSAAYLKLRKILDAFGTPYGPTPEQVWAHTEECAKKIVKAAAVRSPMGLTTRTGIGR